MRSKERQCRSNEARGAPIRSRRHCVAFQTNWRLSQERQISKPFRHGKTWDVVDNVGASGRRFETIVSNDPRLRPVFKCHGLRPRPTPFPIVASAWEVCSGQPSYCQRRNGERSRRSSSLRIKGRPRMSLTHWSTPATAFPYEVSTDAPGDSHLLTFSFTTSRGEFSFEGVNPNQGISKPRAS